MNVFAKLFTAVRGSVREAAEVVVDANALRIFEQEIHECESVIQCIKRDLASVVAEKLRLGREIEALQSAIQERENQAVKVIQAGQESLARQAAELIAEKERILVDHRKGYCQLVEHEARLEKTLRAAISKVKDYRHELRLARATASHQRTFRLLATHTDTVGGKLGDIQDSLERIRQNQQDFADQLQAMEQINRSLSEEALDDRIQNALGSDPVELILERIRKKTAGEAENKD